MSEGVAGKGVVSITETYAHSGKYSLRVADDDTNGDEVVAMSDRTQVEPNTEYLIGAWVKLDGVNPLPVFDVEKAIFFTVTFHSDAEGWAETHGADFFVVNQTEADRDWALYTFRLRTKRMTAAYRSALACSTGRPAMSIGTTFLSCPLPKPWPAMVSKTPKCRLTGPKPMKAMPR
jgi:hypothetical protein